MSDVLLAEYMPNPTENYKMARSLGYEVALKSGVFGDAITIFVFGFVGFFVTLALIGPKFSKLNFQNIDPIVIILLPAFVIGFLLWRLFRIWCIAPSMNEPPSEQCRISQSDNCLILEVGPSRIIVPFNRLCYYLERNEYFAFQSGQHATAMIIPKRAFCENAVDQFRQILTENGVGANWWTSRKLLG